MRIEMSGSFLENSLKTTNQAYYFIKEKRIKRRVTKSKKNEKQSLLSETFQLTNMKQLKCRQKETFH